MDPQKEAHLHLTCYEITLISFIFLEYKETDHLFNSMGHSTSKQKGQTNLAKLSDALEMKPFPST